MYRLSQNKSQTGQNNFTWLKAIVNNFSYTFPFLNLHFSLILDINNSMENG